MTFHVGIVFYRNATQYRFMDAESLLCRANRYRHYYGLEATDISGGETTIYVDPVLTKRGLSHRMPDGRNEHLEYLVRHCADIGLAPSIITHGGNNTEALTHAIEDAGLDCWEFSLHGLGRVGEVTYGSSHRSLVVGHGDREVEDHFERMVVNSKHARRPIRWNCSVTGHTYRDLPAWARFLVERYPPTVGNLIAFMAYDTWNVDNAPDWMLNYPEYAPFIAEAVEILEEHGWEANVRYFPLCIAEKHGFAANCHQHYQIQLDPWEWCYAATSDAILRYNHEHIRRREISEEAFWSQIVAERTRQCDAKARRRHAMSPPCQECAARRICEGPDPLYLKLFGHEWLEPFKGDPIWNVNHFLEKGDDRTRRVLTKKETVSIAESSMDLDSESSEEVVQM